MDAGLDRQEVIVIGGGHAGLALGYHLAHQRRVTDAAGLDFLGMPWRHTRGSARLGWVKDLAHHIADRIASHSPVGVDTPTGHGRPAAALGA